jgi:hypothetical protein
VSIRRPIGTASLADGVAFRIVRSAGGPFPNVELHETRFPLRLSSFRRSGEYPHTRPRPLEQRVVADGRDYFAQAWIGARAPAPLRALLEPIISR